MTPPSHGTAVIDQASILYSPDADFCGTDQFTYSITDLDTQLSDVATVTVNVLCLDSTPDVPLANDDFFTTTKNTSVALLVLDNDTVPQGK